MLIFFLFFSFFPLILGFQPNNSSLFGDSFGDLSLEKNQETTYTMISATEQVMRGRAGGEARSCQPPLLPVFHSWSGRGKTRKSSVPIYLHKNKNKGGSLHPSLSPFSVFLSFVLFQLFVYSWRK